ncbi:MAG: DUF4956 domain-containing protein [Vicinamibacterales bacterium]
MNELFGSAILPAAGVLTSLTLRFLVNVILLAILVRIYMRGVSDRTYVFTFVLLNIVTFSVAFLLSKVPIQLGFAVGLFGVFGILRYRTEAIPARDLTYLFAVIGVALLNSLSHTGISLVELLLVNAVIGGAAALLETATFSKREESRQVVYDRLDLLAPEATEALLADLRQRTRLPVTRYEIGNMDLLKDTAAITVFYRRTPATLQPSRT